MSKEEILEKPPTELVVFMEFMDEILQKYEFKIGNYKVNNEFGEYTLEVLLWHCNANFLDAALQ